MKGILQLLGAAFCFSAALYIATGGCEQKPDPEPIHRSLGLVPNPSPGDTALHVVMGVMEGFYAVAVDDSIVGLVESPTEDDGALLFSTRSRGNTEVARIGDLQVFVIKVPVAFAGQNLIIQISNMGPCATEQNPPWISYGTPIPPDGMVYVDVDPDTVPFMSFYVVAFLPPIHGQYWRLSRTL